MDFGVNLYGPEWSGLASAGVLMGLFARRTGAPLTAGARNRIAWELDKYAPAFGESPGAEIMTRAEPVIERVLSQGGELAQLAFAGKHHGTRLLQKRDRATLTWALAAAVRTAGRERPMDDADSRLFHEVLHESQGAYSVEGELGRVEIGEIDALRHQKDPKGFEALLVSPDPERTRWRVGHLAKHPGLPAHSSWSRGRSFAFLVCAALNVDHTGEPARAALDLANQLYETAHGFGFSETAIDDEDQRVARNAALAAMPNDHTIFMRHFEDHLMLFVDLPRDRQDTLFESLNALMADAAPATAYRHELITVAKAVLALGREVQWRARALPPEEAYEGGGSGGVAPAPQAPAEGPNERPEIFGLLAAFGMKKLGLSDVMRGLMCHEGWLAPVMCLPPGPDGNVVTDRIVTYGMETHLPPGELWLFTEERYAQAAQEKGAALGPYAAGLRGVDVFANVPEGIQKVMVNPGSREQEGFFLGDSNAVALGRVWAEAVKLERRVCQPGALDDPTVRARLRHCKELLMVTVNGHPAVLPDDRGRWLVLFTAPDYAESYCRAMANAKGLRAELQPADGNKLFAVIGQMGVQGVRLNAGMGASEVFIDLPTCARIAAETAQPGS